MLFHFISPLSITLQLILAHLGAISALVDLLLTGSAKGKRMAAHCLTNFSESTPKLSFPVKQRSFPVSLFSRSASLCPVHGGKCSADSSFCLLEAGAVEPLVSVLSEDDSNTQEAALKALSSLIVEDSNWKNGLRCLHEAGAFTPMFQMLRSDNVKLTERVLFILDYLFWLDEYKGQYG